MSTTAAFRRSTRTPSPRSCFGSDHFRAALCADGEMGAAARRQGIDNRQKLIEGDLTEANRLKQQSDEAVAAYEKALAEARARAQTIANETREKQQAESDAARKTLESGLNAKLAEAKNRSPPPSGGHDQCPPSRRCGARHRRTADRCGAEHRAVADAVTDVLKR